MEFLGVENFLYIVKLTKMKFRASGTGNVRLLYEPVLFIYTFTVSTIIAKTATSEFYGRNNSRDKFPPGERVIYTSGVKRTGLTETPSLKAFVNERGVASDY